jgi:hypothetical protein
MNWRDQRAVRVDCILREQQEQRAAEREARGECACGHKLAECRPEVCHHWTAHNARGLGDQP